MGGPLAARVACQALVGVLGLLAVGCADEICLRVGTDDTECPDRLELNRSLQCSGSDVISLDSPGEYEDGYCCYEATKRDLDDFGFTLPPDCFEEQPPEPGGAE